MFPPEMDRVFEKLSELDLRKIDMCDQITIYFALNKLADTIKPVIDKYSNKSECRKDEKSVFWEFYK